MSTPLWDSIIVCAACAPTARAYYAAEAPDSVCVHTDVHRCEWAHHGAWLALNEIQAAAEVIAARDAARRQRLGLEEEDYR